MNTLEQVLRIASGLAPQIGGIIAVAQNVTALLQEYRENASSADQVRIDTAIAELQGQNDLLHRQIQEG